MEMSSRIAQANGRLKFAKVGVQIQQKGGKLMLRATLPPKPNSRKTVPWQQRLAIGLPANPDGVGRAEKEARKLGALLATKEFSWDNYQREKATDALTARVAVEQFKRNYLDNGGSEDTWNGDYWKVLKKLPEYVKIDVQELTELVTATQPNSKTRQRTCMVAGAIARFLEIDFDPTPYRGNYRAGQVEPREIPSDEVIAKCYQSIPNSAWQWVYGMMATYGLRNHEVFHLDMTSFPVVRVMEKTKTGSREVWPCYPEWIDYFSLINVSLPPIDLNRDNQRIGHSVTSYLSPKLEFKPYDLRHAWAIRTSLFGWPVELAARQMGHSVDMHTRTYHRWINRDHQQRVYDVLVNRPDRPVAPSVADSG